MGTKWLDAFGHHFREIRQPICGRHGMADKAAELCRGTGLGGLRTDQCVSGFGNIRIDLGEIGLLAKPAPIRVNTAARSTIKASTAALERHSLASGDIQFDDGIQCIQRDLITQAPLFCCSGAGIALRGTAAVDDLAAIEQGHRCRDCCCLPRVRQIRRCVGISASPERARDHRDIAGPGFPDPGSGCIDLTCWALRSLSLRSMAS